MLSNIKTRASFALVLVGLIWGYAFVVMKNELDFFSVFNLLFWRFLIAFVFLSIFYGFSSDKRLWRDGFIAGSFLFLGYVFQTFGLKYTSVTNSGIITVAYVVFTPLIAFFLDKKDFSKKTFLACMVSFLGLFLVIAEGFRWENLFSNRGDFLTLGCAFAYAAHIVYIAKKYKLHNVFHFTSVQMFTICFLGFFSVLFFEGPLVLPGSESWLSLFFLGVIVSALMFVLQVWSQRVLSYETSAILLTLEAPFAIFFGIFLMGDIVAFEKWIGVAVLGFSIWMVLKEEFKMKSRVIENE